MYRLLTLLTTSLCAVILGISIAGIVTSHRALDLQNRYPSYGLQDISTSIYPEGARPRNIDHVWPTEQTTGWYYRQIPRNIRYNNEEAALGCSAAVLVLVLFPLLSSAFAKVRPTYRSNASGFPRLNIVIAVCCMVVGLVGVVYTQVAVQSTYYDFGRFNTPAPEDLPVEQRTVGNTGIFSVEAWSCNAREVMNMEYDYMSDTCSAAMAAKWLMVALLVTTALLVPLCVFARREAMQRLREVTPTDKAMALEQREAQQAAAEEWWARPGVSTQKDFTLEEREARRVAAKKWWARP